MLCEGLDMSYVLCLMSYVLCLMSYVLCLMSYVFVLFLSLMGPSLKPVRHLVARPII